MSLEALPEGSSLVIRRDQHLERVSATNLLTKSVTDLPTRQGQVFLASDIVTGDYGVTAFILVDAAPEDRWVEYSHAHPLTPCTQGGSYDDREPTHFFHTRNGFKMIRNFILPETVKRFFEQDRFLGEPMIQKCCLDGTIPDDFDEEPVDPEFTIAQSIGDFYDRYEKLKIKKAQAERIMHLISPDLEQLENPDSYKRTFLSFHAWWDYYQRVLASGQESLYLAVANFDEVLSRFDQREVLIRRGLINLPPQTDKNHLLNP